LVQLDDVLVVELFESLLFPVNFFDFGCAFEIVAQLESLDGVDLPRLDVARLVDLAEAPLSNHLDHFVLVHDLIVVEAISLVIVVNNLFISDKNNIIILQNKA
jgi:hypothetical protein